MQLFKDENVLVSHQPPFKPSAGDVYVYTPLTKEESGISILCICLKWYFIYLITR